MVLDPLGFRKSSGRSLRKARERSVAILEVGAASEFAGSLKVLSVAIGFARTRRWQVNNRKGEIIMLNQRFPLRV